MTGNKFPRLQNAENELSGTLNTNIQRDDSIKILIRHVCSMYHRSNHHGKMLKLAEFTHYITISISQTPKLYPILFG